MDFVSRHTIIEEVKEFGELAAVLGMLVFVLKRSKGALQNT
jgi:hypothetical protein